MLGENLKNNLERIHELYQMVTVRPQLYVSECWTVRKIHFQKLQTAEMRFLRSVNGYTRLDEIRNADRRK